MIIAVDVDDTLTIGTSWTEKDCLKASPRKKMIEWVNEKYKTDYIVIHTARRHNLYGATIRWLEKNNVHYHSVCFEKMPADLYVDDKAIRPNEITSNPVYFDEEYGYRLKPSKFIKLQ